jgi:hypothetical protein
MLIGFSIPLFNEKNAWVVCEDQATIKAQIDSGQVKRAVGKFEKFIICTPIVMASLLRWEFQGFINPRGI